MRGIAFLIRFWINQIFRLEYYIEAVLSHCFLKLKGSNYKNRIIFQTDKNILFQKIDKNKKKRLAIFVAFHDPRKVPESNIQYIKFLNNCNFDVVYIHNGILSKEVIEKLNDMGCYLIIRKNIGQDFGAWKDAFALIDEYKIRNILNWIMICNDSNFCINGSEKLFINHFNETIEDVNEADFVSLNCNFESRLHYQSYFLCFGKAVFNNKEFKQFWKNYLPLNHRYHSIEKGEKKLTEKILSKFKSKILLNSYNLYEEIISQNNDDDFYSLLTLLPKHQTFLKDCFNGNSFKIGLSRMLDILESYNPSHIFALMYIYYLKSPFLKKDIVRQGLYSLNQIHKPLSSSKLKLPKEIINEVMDFYTRDGTNYSYKENLRKAARRGIPDIQNSIYQNHLDTRLLIDPEGTLKKGRLKK